MHSKDKAFLDNALKYLTLPGAFVVYLFEVCDDGQTTISSDTIETLGYSKAGAKKIISQLEKSKFFIANNCDEQKSTACLSVPKKLILDCGSYYESYLKGWEEKLNYAHQTPKLELVEDHENKVVRIGKWESSLLPSIFYKSRNYRYKPKETKFDLFKKDVLKINGINVDMFHSYDPKFKSYLYNQVLPYSLNAKLWAISHKFWISKNPSLFFNACQLWVDSRLIFLEEMVLNFHRYYELILETENDGLTHLLPLVTYFGMSPQALKKYFGKAAWKRLANAKKTRIKLILMAAIEIDSIDDSTPFDEPGTIPQKILPDKNIKQLIIEISTLRTTLVKNLLSRAYLSHSGHFSEQDYKYYCWYNKNGKILKEVDKYLHLFVDTHRMASILELPFNERWSASRMKYEHDRMSRLIKQKQLAKYLEDDKYVDDEFRTLVDIIHPGVIDDVKIELLRTPRRIVTEALTMNHCVDSYIEDVLYVDVMIFHLCYLENNISHEATLGVDVNASALAESQRYRIFQCYRESNLEPHQKIYDVAHKLLSEIKKVETNAA